MAFDVRRVRRDFPILARKVPTVGGRSRRLVYLDHGASTHAPKPVIDAVVALLSNSYANIHRGHHALSVEASDLFDDSLETLTRFVGGNPETDVALLGQNTTMALDMAAHLMQGVKGTTLTTAIEHHSNLLPHRVRGKTLHAEVDDAGRLLLEDVQRNLDKSRIKLLAVSGASNVTGSTPPLGKLARMAHDAGARILVDAAQLYAHAPIDVKPEVHPEHIDFLAAAGHKSYAPLGAAFLLAPRDLADQAPPYMPGGGTVEWVTDDSAMYTKSPDRHMGGTPNIVGAVAFAAATRYLDAIGMDEVRAHEQELSSYALKRFAEDGMAENVQLLGPTKANEKVGVFSFAMAGHRHEFVSAALNHEFGVATRNGCFCAQPLLNRLLGLGATPAWTRQVSAGKDVPRPGAVRATLGIYNKKEELDVLFDGLDAIARGRLKARYETHDHRHCVPIDAAEAT